MTWNYRVIKHTDGTYAIHEVYYSKNAKIEGWTKEPVDLWQFDSARELFDDLRVMQKAANLPILAVKEILIEVSE